MECGIPDSTFIKTVYFLMKNIVFWLRLYGTLWIYSLLRNIDFEANVLMWYPIVYKISMNMTFVAVGRFAIYVWHIAEVYKTQFYVWKFEMNISRIAS